MRASIISIRVTTILLVCLAARSACAYQVRIDTSADAKGYSGYHVKWDSVQDRVILYRNISVATIPGIRILDSAGNSTPAYPLRDLQGAKSMSIWSAAATPDGGAVVSAAVVYSGKDGKPTARRLLLTYDASGILRKVWDTSPYHHHYLAVDRDGNVYGLGERNDTSGSYPLLVKYSPTGDVLTEFLSSDLFMDGDNIVEASRAGETHMYVKGDEIILYLAPTQEVFRFSLDGNLLNRVSLAPALKRIATGAAKASAEVLAFGIDETGQFVAQMYLWPSNHDGRGVKVAVVRFAPDGQQEVLAAPLTDGPAPGILLGAASDGHLIFQDAQGMLTKQQQGSDRLLHHGHVLKCVPRSWRTRLDAQEQ